MKTKFEPIEYKPEFLEMAFNFLSVYHILDIDIDSMFQLSKKEKEQIEKLKRIYSKIKLMNDAKQVQSSYITTDDALELADNFLMNILPHKKQEIKELNNLVVFDNIDTYKAGLEYRMSKNGVELGRILIPENCSYYDMSTIGHEKVHALAFENLELVSLFKNGVELFPMAFEKMILVDLQDEIATTYSNIVRVNDTKTCFFNLSSIDYLKQLQENKELNNEVYKYFYIKSHDYLISELKSSLLAKYYQLDKEKMKSRLSQLFDGKITIENFLDSYNINLSNKDLIPTIKEETAKCKRIVIIP